MDFLPPILDVGRWMLLCRKDAMGLGWWTELRCDSVCPRSGHLSAWPCSKRTANSAAPALRWAAEFSQRENCHPPNHNP